MNDFDPDHQPETKEEADEYVRWCVDGVNDALSDPETPRTYLHGERTAAKLLVVSTAMLHLDESVEEYRKVYDTWIAFAFNTSRCLERGHRHVTMNHVMKVRMALDFFKGADGAMFGGALLAAGKCASSAVTLILQAPLSQRGDIEAPDMWALIEAGASFFEPIRGMLGEDEFSIEPAPDMVQRVGMHFIERITRSVGAPSFHPN